MCDGGLAPGRPARNPSRTPLPPSGSGLSPTCKRRTTSGRRTHSTVRAGAFPTTEHPILQGGPGGGFKPSSQQLARSVQALAPSIPMSRFEVGPLTMVSQQPLAPQSLDPGAVKRRPVGEDLRTAVAAITHAATWQAKNG